MYSYAMNKSDKFSFREYFFGTRKTECACERAMRLKAEANANAAASTSVNAINTTITHQLK